MSPSTVGYCTRTMATTPSGETSSVVPSTFGRPATVARTASRATCAVVDVVNVVVSSIGVMTTCAVMPPPVGTGGLEQVDRGLRVETGHDEGVLHLLAEAG